VASVRALLRIKQSDHDLRAANARRELVYNLAARQRMLDKPGAITEVACVALGEFFGAQRVGFYAVLSDDELEVLSCWARDGFPTLMGRQPMGVVDRRLVAEYREGRTAVLRDSGAQSVIPATPISSAIGVPLIRAGRWEGTLFVNADPERIWSPSEISLVEEVAQLSWDAVDRAEAKLRLEALNVSLEERIDVRTRELLNAEAQLRQAQKMEAVGQLTGGIAHDFNNLLTAIIGGIRMIRRRLDEKRFDDVDRFMEEVNNSAMRAASLTQRLLAFSRRQSLDFRSVDIGKLIADIQGLLGRTLGETITLKTDLPAGLWPGQTDASQLEMALLNLTINARDAMPNGGTLRICAQNTDVVPGKYTDVMPGSYLRVDVSDSGTGMSEDVLARVFDPFFTTKPIGQGTGLGLSMVYGFVKQSRGHVEITSKPGCGTTVTILLPRGEEVAVAASVAPVTVAMPKKDGTQSVLVVEDNAAIRLLVTESLLERGYKIREASDGTQAAAMLKASAFDLLLTDVGLPGMNGRDVAAVALENHPAIKVLFITGYAEAAQARADFLPPGAEMMTKPFEVEALVDRVAAMLAR
jgi:signal transduction histidine kinase/CheY-like chemotaxis protein